MTKIFLIRCAPLAAFLFLAAETYGQTSYTPKTLTLKEGGSEVLGRFSYFQSRDRVTPDGESFPFEEGESFSMMDFDLEGAYGLTNNLQATLGIGLRHNQSKLLSGDEEISQTASGLKSGLVGLKYAFPNQEGLRFSLEANYRPTFFTNEEGLPGDTQNLVLGDDGAGSSFGAGFSLMSNNSNFFTGKVLYRNPSPNLSSEVFTEVEGALVWESFALIGGVELVNSLEQDAYTDDPENKPPVNGGSSFLFNSVNRSWTAPYLGMNFAIGKLWRIEGRYQSRVSGASTDLGDSLIITLARRKEETKAFQKKNQAFKEYTVEGTVTKVSKSGKAALIDAGLDDGLEKGSKIDFYHFDYVGGNELIAAGFVVKVGATKSLVKVTKRYAKKRVEEGTLARGGLVNNNL